MRQALALAEKEAKSQDGWKLLEGPPDSANVFEDSGLLEELDSTRPEPGWKVVGVGPDPVPGSPQTGPESAARRPPPPKRPPLTATTPLAKPKAGGVNAGASQKAPPPRQPPSPRIVPRPRAFVKTRLGVAPPSPPVEPIPSPDPTPAPSTGMRPRADSTPDGSSPAGPLELASTPDSTWSAPPQSPEPIAPDPRPDAPLTRTALSENASNHPPLAHELQTNAPGSKTVDPLATTQQAFAPATVQPAVPSEPTAFEARAPAEGVQPPALLAAREQPPAARPALPSDALATAHDSIQSASIPSMPVPRLRLRQFAAKLPTARLIGLGSAALVAAGAIATLVVFAVAKPSADATELQKTPPAPVAASKHATRAKQSTSAAADNGTARGSLQHARTAPAPARPKQAKPPPSSATEASPAGVPWTAQGDASTESCQTLARLEPGAPKGFLYQRAVQTGQAELIRGNLKAAHVAFCQASLIGQPTSTVLLGLTQVLLMQSDLDQALESVDRLLQLKPHSARALDLRGDILIRMGHVDEARKAWFRAAGASRESELLISNLLRANRSGVDAALKVGDLARAERRLRRVIALDPKDADACAELASTLFKSGQASAATHWLAYAESLDPENPKLISVKSALAHTG